MYYKKRVGLVAVGDIAKKVLAGKSGKNKMSVQQMIVAWEGIVGKSIHKHCSPTRLQARCLTIAVNNHVWSNQLNFMKNDLIQKINSFYNKPVINEIRLTIARIDKVKKVKIKPVPVMRQLTSNDKDFIETTTASIKDTALQAKIRRLIYKDLSREK